MTTQKVKRQLLEDREEWAADVLEKHFPDSEISDNLREGESISDIKEELVDRCICLVSGESELHSYIVQIDIEGLTEGGNLQKIQQVVTDHANDAVIDTSELIEDERVNVLGEFKMGVLATDTSGDTTPTVSSSSSGLIKDNE